MKLGMEMHRFKDINKLIHDEHYKDEQSKNLIAKSYCCAQDNKKTSNYEAWWWEHNILPQHSFECNFIHD